MKYLAIILFLVLTGCAGPRIASTHQVERDSTYASRRHLDSLYRALFERDSTYRRDSIYVYVKGDTVTRYTERTLYKWRTRTDTVYRDRWRTDTVYTERADTVLIEKPVYVEKPAKWYNQGFIWLGKLCCLGLVIWLLMKRIF